MGDGLVEELRRSWRRAALRFGRWPRRVLALACLTLAALSAVDAADRSAARTAVVVAVRDIPAGSALRTADLRVASWPAPLASPRALHRLADATGRIPAAAIAAGEAVTTARLLGADLAVGLPGGTVVATVLVASAAAASVLHAGEHVDLLRAPAGDGTAARASPAERLASDVLVLAVLADRSGGESVSIAVAVDPDTALRLTAAADTPVIATVRPR